MKDNLFFGLFLKEADGVCFILEKYGNKLKIINKEKFSYSNGWENLSEDVDEALFSLESKTKKRVKKTIFFVYSHLIDESNGEIIKPYLGKIKNLSKNLELEPVGYIECYQAVVDYIEKKEQLPLTSIILELDNNNLDLFIYKGGHKVYVQKIAKTDNIISDLQVAFQSIKDKTLLPSRIIIYNSTSVEKVSSQIVSQRWSQEIFIQMPRVEIINEEEFHQSLIDLFNQQLFQKIQEIKQPEKKEVMGFVIGDEVTQPTLTRPAVKIFPFIEKISLIKNMIKIPKVSLNLAIIIGILLILVSLTIFELFLHQATITVFLPSKQIKDQLEIDTLNILVASKTADLKKTKITTGKKQIGDKARGETTIHNFDDKEKIFPKGIILDSSGFQFTLDEEIKVASSSLASDGSAKLPGKEKGKITAVVLGPESNLAKGKRFSFENLSSSLFFAINEAVLSGGTKKEVTTVSKTDIDELTTQLLSEGKKMIEKQEDNNNTNLVKMITPLTEYKLENVVPSKEIGEEASQVEIKAKLVVNYYSYRENDLLDLIKRELIKTIPQEYSITTSNITYKITKAEKIKNKISLIIDINGKAIKDVDRVGLIKKLPGKNKKQIELLFKNNFQLTGFEMDVKPKNIIFNNWLPLRQKNIDIKFSSL